MAGTSRSLRREMRLASALLLAAGLLPGAAPVLAAQPAGDTVTAPSSGSVTRDYTGTVPAGTGGTAECAEGVNADLYTFTIAPLPESFYATRTATVRFRIRWAPTEPSDIVVQDLLLRVFLPNGSSGESDGSGTSEVVILTNPVAGAYRVYACSFLAVLPQAYQGDVTLEVAPNTGTVGNPPSTPSTIRFGPITTVDPQRDVAEPSMRVDGDGNEYICGPFGSSRAAEYAQKSEDQGDTFRILGTQPEGRIAPGGGGDCEISVARERNALGYYTLSYTGLAALVNFSTGRSQDAGRSFLGNAVSESPVAVDRQWMDSVGANEVYLTYKQVPTGSFVQRSTDGGLTYGPGALAITEISRSGNILVDNRPGREDDVYIVHAFNEDIRIARSRDADALVPDYEIIVVKTGCATEPPPPNDRNCTRGRPDTLFPSLAQDAAGTLYAAWVEAGTYNLYYAFSTDDGTTWSTKVQVNRDALNTAVMPWIDAGDTGRIAISYYGTEVDGNPQLGTFRAPWDVYVNTVTDAHLIPANPDDKAVTQTKVTTHPIHWNSICLSGLGCSLLIPQGDRTLLDFFQVKHDPEGRLRVTYNESNKRYQDELGRIAIVTYSKQTAGPDLIGAAEAPDARPLIDVGRLDRAVDALYPFSIFPAPATPPSPPFRTNYEAMDVRSIMARPNAAGDAVTFTVQVADLSAVTLTAAQAGLSSPNLLYVVRFFSGYEARAAIASVDATGAFSYGYTDLAFSADGKLETYPPTEPIIGSFDFGANEIKLSVPYAKFENVRVNSTDPAAAPIERTAKTGDLIHEVTAFTFGNPSGEALVQAYLVQADSTAPFDYELGSRPSVASLRIGDVRKLEGDSGTKPFPFIVTRTGDLSGTSTVHYRTRSGTATVPEDYIPIADGVIMFPPGTTTRTVTVQVKGDGKRAPDETFFVELSQPSGATISDGRGLGTIVNDDPYLRISDASVDEPATGATRTVRFVVTLSYPTVQDVTVSFRTRNGTAVAPGDYTARTGTRVFRPGETVKYVDVVVNGGGGTESDETFFLDLFDADFARIDDGVGRAVIRD